MPRIDVTHPPGLAFHLNLESRLRLLRVISCTTWTTKLQHDSSPNIPDLSTFNRRKINHGYQLYDLNHVISTDGICCARWKSWKVYASEFLRAPVFTFLTVAQKSHHFYWITWLFFCTVSFLWVQLSIMVSRWGVLRHLNVFQEKRKLLMSVHPAVVSLANVESVTISIVK